MGLHLEVTTQGKEGNLMSKYFREITKTVLYNQRFSPKRREIHIYFGVRKSFLSQETVHMEDNQFGAAFLLL